MATRKIVVVGDKTTTGGVILPNANSTFSIGNAAHKAALIGGPVQCPVCKSNGVIAKAGGPRRMNFMGEVALENDIVLCGCSTPPKLVADLHHTMTYDDGTASHVAASVIGSDASLDVLGSLLNGKGLPLTSDFSIDSSMQDLPPRIVPRSAYSQIPIDPTKLRTYGGPYTGIILHHTGSETTPQQVENVQRGNEPFYDLAGRAIGSMFHLANTYTEYGDVGYNYMIAGDGTIYEGRSLQYVGAHVVGHNIGNIGIAFLGDYTDHPLSNAAIASGVQLIIQLRDRFNMGVNGENFISTHGQYNEEK